MADVLAENLERFAREFLHGFAPPPDTTVHEWAEAHRVIAQGNAEPGKWRTDRAPYLKAIMDDVSDDTVHEIVVTGCSQGGKTEVGQNVVGWAASCDPCTAIWCCPNDGSAATASSRFDAMIDCTPELKSRFGSRTARSQTNNVGLKEFIGGKLVIASAGSPSSLASHPARLVVGDEVDRFPLTLRREGDPIGLLRARTSTFSRRKMIWLSSPTQAGTSRIEALFDVGDRREWAWKCACGADHIPEWPNVSWEPGRPETVTYTMSCCGSVLSNAERLEAMQRGKWIATAAGQPGVRSYRIRGLSSPWLSLELLAREFEAAKGSPVKLAPFFNTRLGLVYEPDQGEGVEAETIADLAENYAGNIVPDGAALLVAGVDVQEQWLAVQIAAVGLGDEFWSLQWIEVPGDTLDPATWAKLEDVLTQRFRHVRGSEMQIEAVVIDAGFRKQVVHEFSAKHRAKGRRWFASFGRSGADRPLWRRGGDITRSLAKWHIVGTDAGKAQVMAGAVQTDHGPGKWHFRADYPAHFFEWLCAEEAVIRETAGGSKTEWRLKRGMRRNEALDTAVLCLAGRYSFDVNIELRLERLAGGGGVKPAAVSMKELAARAAKLSQGTRTHAQ